MKFEKNTLVSLLDSGKAAVLEEKLIDSDRWSLYYSLVFAYDGKTYQTKYSKGATEYQMEELWEYEDEVECTLVEQKEVLVKQWVPVEVDE
jgi:hypothetical protein